MNDYIIPQDVKNISKVHDRKIILKWLICTLAVVLIVFYVNSRADKLNIKGIPFYITEIFLILPFFLTKAYRLFDRSWTGIIITTEPIYYTKYDANGYTKWNFTHKSYMEGLILHIKMPNGRIRKYKAFEQCTGKSHEKTGKTQPIIDYYQTGDTVIHVKGTRFLQVVSPEKENTVCVVCGTLDNSENGVCTVCEHTLKIEKQQRIRLL